MRRVPLKPIYFLLRIQETFDTKRKSLIFDTEKLSFVNTSRTPFPYARVTMNSRVYDIVIGSWLAFSGLARSAGTVVFPLGLGESVLVFPLTTRLTLHLFCRYSSSLSLLLFLWLITFALVVMHACR